MRLIFNNRGFNFIQFMIASMIMSGVFLASMKIIQNQTKLANSSSDFFEAIYLVDDIKTFLSNTSNCEQNLKGKSTSIKSLPGLFSSDGKIAFSLSNSPENRYGQGNISLNQFSIQSLGGVISKGVNELTFTVKIGLIDSKDIFSKSFIIHYQVNDDGYITSCHSLPGIRSTQLESKSFWENDVTKRSFKLSKTLSLKNKLTATQELRSNASIIVEGALNVSSQQNECLDENEGKLFYSKKINKLIFCDQSTTKEINVFKKQDLDSKMFSLKTYRVGKLNKDLGSNWSACHIKTFITDNGNCYVNKVDNNFILNLERFSGRENFCETKCYKF